MTLHLAELTPRERVGQISQLSVPVAIVAGAALGRLWWHAPLAQPPLKLQPSKPQSSIFMNACALSGHSQHESTMQMCGAEVAP